MKAVQIKEYGGNGVLEINANTSKPTLAKGQILVEVHAASINPVDWKIRAGYLKEMAPLAFPTTLGGDFAGVIVGVGDDIADFKVGDQVFGQAIVLNGGSGSFAEFVAANANNTAHKPQSINFIDASALPLAGSSALQALEDHIKLRRTQKILIHGGAGGIGHLAIQIAKVLGAYVATTVSAKDIEYVKNLGADEIIDYKTQSFEELLKDFDAVFDTVGGETTAKSFKVLKKGGIIVSMLGQPDMALAQKYGVIGIGQGTKTDTKHLDRLAKLVDGGKVKVHVDKVFPIEQVKEAFTYVQNSHPRGKVVLKIKEQLVFTEACQKPSGLNQRKIILPDFFVGTNKGKRDTFGLCYQNPIEWVIVNVWQRF